MRKLSSVNNMETTGYSSLGYGKGQKSRGRNFDEAPVQANVVHLDKINRKNINFLFVFYPLLNIMQKYTFISTTKILYYYIIAITFEHYSSNDHLLAAS